MTKQELKQGTKAWYSLTASNIYYTGYEGTERKYDHRTKEFIQAHYYKFVDICGREVRIYDLDKLKIVSQG